MKINKDNKKEKDKSFDLVMSLIEKTLDNKIKWSLCCNDSIKHKCAKEVGSTEESLGRIFLSEIGRFHIRLFKYKTKNSSLSTKYFNLPALESLIPEFITVYRLETYNKSSLGSDLVFEKNDSIANLYSLLDSQEDEKQINELVEELKKFDNKS